MGNKELEKRLEEAMKDSISKKVVSEMEARLKQVQEEDHKLALELERQ